MRALKAGAVFLLAMALAGCWGSRETDEIAYIVAMGFDKGPDNSLIMTFQIANPRTIAGASGASGGGGGGGGGNSQALITVSTEAKLPIGAFNLLNTELSRSFSLLHTRAYIFSEDLAREGLRQYLNPLERFRETRGTAFVYICRETAREFMMKNQPRLEVTPVKQYELVAGVNRRHGLAPVVQFREFYENTKSPVQEPVAPLVNVSEKGIHAPPSPPNRLGDFYAGDMPSDRGFVQFLGAAVFRGDKMVGRLTGDETRYLNMITGNLREGFLIIEDPESPELPLGITLRQARKPDIKVRFGGEVPEVNVDIYQEPEIVGVASGIDYEAPGKKPVLEKALEEIIRQRCSEVVARSQDEFKSDIFGFGKYARMNFLTVSRWENAHWVENYPRARVNINVHVKIRRTGLMMKTRQIRT
jgi:spore germination protein KC